MKKIVCAVAGVLCAVAASADDAVLQVWTCTLNEGHTLEELIDVHEKWVKWASDQPGGEDVEGSILTSVISENVDSVLIVDSWASPSDMTASWKAYMDTVGEDMEAAYDEVSTCSSNSLWYAREIEADD